MASEQRTLRFCAANIAPRLARPGAAAKRNVKPCSVEETRGAVLHVRQGAVRVPNKRAPTRATHVRSSKDMPRRWLVLQL